MKEISKTDYYKLLGLRYLADMKNKELDDLKFSVAEITGEELDNSNYGHASDFVYGDMTPKELLKKLDIKIAK